MADSLQAAAPPASPAQPPEAASPGTAGAPSPPAELVALHARYDICQEEARPAGGPRRVLVGLLRRLLYRMVGPVLHRQRDFNAALVRMTSTLWEQLEAVRQDVRLNKRHHDLRLDEAIENQHAALQAIQKNLMDASLDQLLPLRQQLERARREVEESRQRQAQTLEEIRAGLASQIEGLSSQHVVALHTLRAGIGHQVQRLVEQTARSLEELKELRARPLVPGAAPPDQTGSAGPREPAPLPGAPESPGTAPGAASRPAPADKLDRDALYAAHQRTFRGPRELIKQRLAIYLPHVLEAQAATGTSRILDLGSGRGEWLELARDQALEGHGFDENQVFVEYCLARGLKVEARALLGGLWEQPDGSLAAVTAFHVVEHLAFETLLKLLDQILRVLRPGGLAILETPNPANLVVASLDFHNDPTHRAPVPAPLLRFLAEERGFRRVDRIDLNPAPASERFPGEGELVERLNAWFCGPQDYALLAWKG